MPQKIEIQTIRTDTFEMEYFAFGTGTRSFVMIPGMSLTSVMLSADEVADVYADFAEKYTVYLFDRKKNIQPGYTIKDMAQDTAIAMQKAGISDADILGCSQGGMIAQYLAILHPELVHKLILASTMSRGNPISDHTWDVWSALIEKGDIRGLNRAVHQRVYSPAYYEQYRDIFHGLEEAGTPDEVRQFAILIDANRTFAAYDQLDQIKCPALVLGAREDHVLSGEASLEIAEKLGCPVYLYESFGHAAYDEAPDYKTRMLQFFEEN